MTQSLDEMLNSLPSKEDLDNAPRYCKWCDTWNPEITKGEATHITGFKYIYTVGTQKFNYLKDAKSYIDSMDWENMGIKEN